MRALLLLLAFPLAVPAADLTVLSGNGARVAVAELASRFARETGNKVSVRFYVNPEVKKRIDAGEAFDVAVLNPPFLDALIKEKKVRGETRAVLGRAGIGVGIKAGAPKPDLSTVDAFKRLLLSSRAVAYPGEGASGKYFVSVVERLGIMADMKPRLRPMPAEYNVEGVASGEFDLVVVVASRIAGVRGVELAGRIPEELQTWIGFTAGVGAQARDAEAAKALVRYMVSPAARPVIEAAGIQAFVE
jgi:molybdate transport system substrate-binding protein